MQTQSPLHQDILESLTEYDLDAIVEVLCQLHDACEILALIEHRSVAV